MIAGKPSHINIHLQPTELIRYPDNMDIQSIVAGLPRIRKVFALERSAFVNHLLKISMAGITALSTTPSINRITINELTLLTSPVAIANPPQRISDQKINFFALFLDA